MISLKLLKRVSAVALAIATLNLAPLKSEAQYNPSKPPQKKGVNVANLEPLTQKISINGLPEYSGKQKFIAGGTHKTEVGPQYTERFLAMEPPTQVVDWYRGALSSYKWEIVSSDSNKILAKKADGSSVSIIADPFKSKDGRTMVRINYHDYHQRQLGGDQ